MSVDHSHEPQPPAAYRPRRPLTPNERLGFGCLAIIIFGTAVLYCAGTASILFRPTLREYAVATPTVFVRPTSEPTATQPKPTIITLPPVTLISTPTQAPIPTRELPTLTPTVDLTNPSPTITATRTITITRTPTRRVTETITVRP